MLDRVPKEIAEDIFSRLPLKSLLRCMCVSKSFRSLIKKPSLISAHLRRSISSSSGSSKYRAVFQGVNQEVYSFPIKKNQILKLHGKLFVQTTFYSLRTASCNGLVSIGCYSRGSCTKFILWNPSIGKHLVVPAFKDTDIEINRKFLEFHGLGYDLSTADFKLVRVIPVSNGGLKVHVFSLDTGSWTNIPNIESRYLVRRAGNPVFVNGKIHWLATACGECILGFDVGNNSFFEISVPLGTERCEFLTAYGDSSIALAFNGYSCSPYTIWVMKEYGVAESWIKIDVEVETTGHGWARVLGFNTGTTNEILIVENEEIPGLLLSIDCITRQAKCFGVLDVKRSDLFLGEFVECLALLDKENEVSNNL